MGGYLKCIKSDSQYQLIGLGYRWRISMIKLTKYAIKSKLNEKNHNFTKKNSGHSQYWDAGGVSRHIPGQLIISNF